MLIFAIIAFIVILITVFNCVESGHYSIYSHTDNSFRHVYLDSKQSYLLFINFNCSDIKLNLCQPNCIGPSIKNALVQILINMNLHFCLMEDNLVN